MIDSVLQNLPAPTPNVTLMGDLNFPSSVISWHLVDGVLLPRVAGHRVQGDQCEGGKERLQAAKLCELAVKYNLTQQIGLPTREREILDLIWSSNPDLISNVLVDTFKDFTDHSVITATTTYRLDREVNKEEQFLLDSGQRFRRLDFNKAPWPDIQKRLRQVVWGPLEL